MSKLKTLLVTLVTDWIGLIAFRSSGRSHDGAIFAEQFLLLTTSSCWERILRRRSLGRISPKFGSSAARKVLWVLLTFIAIIC